MKLISLTILFLAIGSFARADAKPAAITPAFKCADDMATKGKVLFEKNCTVCHGATGAGDGPAAVALKPKPRNFSKEAFKNGDKPEEVFTTITKGFAPQMAPFDSIVAEDRKNLACYVLSLKK